MFKTDSIRGVDEGRVAIDAKQRLYNAYVSSGQVRDTGETVEALLRPREPYIAALIARHFPADRSARILDVGCGHGAFLYFLKRAGYSNLRGVDVSPDQIALAHRLGIPEAEQGNADSLMRTTPGESADVVLLIDVLEHLTREELLVTLDDVFRVLRPGGRAIVHVPNAEGLYGMRVRYGDLTHEQAFTPQSAQQAFSTAGFRDIACFEDKPVVHGAFSLVRRLLWEAGTLPHRCLLRAETGAGGFVLSQNMLVVACK